MSSEKEQIEEELARLRGDYYKSSDREADKALLQFQGSLLGAGAAAESYRRRLKKRKVAKQAKLPTETPVMQGVGRGAVPGQGIVGVPGQGIVGVPDTYRPRSLVSKAWGGVKKVASGVGKVAQYASIPMILARASNMSVYNKKFGEQVNGRYFDYKKAANQWTWLLIAIDTILSFAPYLNIVSTIMDLTDFGASTIEGAVGDENRTVSKYTDWVTAVEQLLVSIAYEDWKKEMKTLGKSQWTADFGDIEKSFDKDRYAMSSEELLPDEWVKDRKDGKISDALWNVLTKLARGETAQAEIKSLSDKEWKQLTKDYMIDTTKTSFIVDTQERLKREVTKNMRDVIMAGDGYLQSRKRKARNADIDRYIRDNGAENAFSLYFKGMSFPITWNNQQITLNDRQGFILYMMIRGDDSFLRNANQETKDFFKTTLGVLPFEEGQTEIKVSASGEVAEEFYRKGQEKQKEALEPVWKKVEGKFKNIRPGAYKKIREMEQRALNPNFADPNQELQYMYLKRKSLWDLRDVYQTTNAKLRPGASSGFNQVWLIGFKNPETGVEYKFKDPVDTYWFWQDPQKYAAEFGNKIYVNAEGRGYQKMDTMDEDAKKKYEEELGELGKLRQKEIDLYTQEQGRGSYVRQAGASLAGGAPVTGQYVSGGRASLAGGMRVQPSKK